MTTAYAASAILGLATALAYKKLGARRAVKLAALALLLYYAALVASRL